MEERINEVKVNKNLDYIPMQVISPLCKSVCKIIIKNFISNEIISCSGFFIKLEKGDQELFCLISCGHILTKEFLNSNRTIEVIYNKQNNRIIISLNKNERFMRDYTYLNIDASIIEIIPKDGVQPDFFLKPNLNYIDHYENLNKKKIYILYPDGSNLNLSVGEINSINIIKTEFTYSVKENINSPGSPIILENTNQVIGICKKPNFHTNKNFGNFIGVIWRSLKLNRNYTPKENSINNKFEGEFSDDQFEADGKLFNYYINEKYYIGHIIQCDPHGMGVLYNKNNNIIYEGEFAFGKIEGIGKAYNDEDYYIGQFANSNLNGKGIIYNLDDTIKFEGTFENGKCKEGRFNYSDGSYYIGEFMNDYKHGKGKLYNKDGTIKYDGYYYQGKYGGEGLLYFGDNCKYYGEFIEGTFNGKGYYFENDILIYEGDFYNNYFEGKGKMYDKNNFLIYEGDFHNDKFNGNGKRYFKSGNYYEGQFINNELSGNGTIYNKKGDIIYEGEFKGNTFEGNGRYNYENGEFYIGHFIKGDENGDGILFNIDGSIKYEGKFINGNYSQNNCCKKLYKYILDKF